MTTNAADRPLRADARRNRERIVAAAREVFARAGLEAQMDDVAAQAGVGVGTVYRHFPTKQTLMGEMIAERFRGFVARAREAVDAPGDPFAVFAAMIREGAAEVAEDVGTQHAMLTNDDATWALAAPIKDELLTVNQVLIDRAKAAGTLRADFSADDIPVMMCGVCATMAMKPASSWERHLELLLDGIRAR